MKNLTSNERLVLNAFPILYNDAHSVKEDLGSTLADPADLAVDTGKVLRSVNGSLGSLAKKGLVTTEDEQGLVSLTPAGVDVAFEDRKEPAPVEDEGHQPPRALKRVINVDGSVTIYAPHKVAHFAVDKNLNHNIACFAREWFGEYPHRWNKTDDRRAKSQARKAAKAS